MHKKLFFIFPFFLLTSLIACGGGSSGTAIGGDYIKISGIVVAPDGSSLSNTEVKVLNSNHSTFTDDSGAFEIRTEKILGEVALALKATDGSEASVTLNPIPEDKTDIELSLLFDIDRDYASLLDLTLSAKIVRSCSPFFLNSRTIKQISPIPDNFVCTIEATIKYLGLPADNLKFELQYRSCDESTEWKSLKSSSTGTSGSGTGEIDFNFTNDKDHCFYRIFGPIDVANTNALNVQINTLRKGKE